VINSFSKIRIISFDVDLTLTYSKKTDAFVFWSVLKKNGYPHIEFSKVKKAFSEANKIQEKKGYYWHNNAQKLAHFIQVFRLHRLGIPANKKLIDKINYQFANARNHSAYPDVIPTLEFLKKHNFTLAIVTNGIEPIIIDRLLSLHLLSYFSIIIAAATWKNKKPHPQPFQQLIKLAKLKGENILHIGDDPINDYQSAQTQGIKTILIDRTHKFVGSHYDSITDLTQLHTLFQSN